MAFEPARRFGSFVRVLVFAALTLAAVPTATAAPCAGFTDVDDTSAFCKNVEWLKNRSITLGCSSTTLFCPADGVVRLAMAAFMNRLGTALTPTPLFVEAAPGAVDLDVPTVVCQTSPFVVAAYPRRAFIESTVYATSGSAVTLGADVAMSVNGGAFTNMNTVPKRGSAPGGAWGGLSDIGAVDLAVGQSVTWGVRLSRGGIAGTADLTNSRCQLRVLIHSRDGVASPY